MDNPFCDLPFLFWCDAFLYSAGYYGHDSSGMSYDLEIADDDGFDAIMARKCIIDSFRHMNLLGIDFEEGEG